MKKYLATVMITIVSFSILLVPSVYAQGNGDPNADINDLPEVVEEGGFTEGDEVADQILEEEQIEAESSSDDFTMGLGVGAGFGVIVGIILGWLFKDKII